MDFWVIVYGMKQDRIGLFGKQDDTKDVGRVDGKMVGTGAST